MSRQRVKAEPVSVSPLRVAPSSRVNAPGDRFEDEAERLAQRMTGARVGEPVDVQPAGSHVQRAAEGSASIPELNGSLRFGGGEPLPSSVEGQMAGHLGHSFAEVRIHRDDYAAHVSRQLNARAFTYDRHLFFGDGAYDPHSAAGQRLLGHELVHTLQQSGQGSMIQRAKLSAAEKQQLDAAARRGRQEEIYRLKQLELNEDQLRKLARVQGKLTILQTKHQAIRRKSIKASKREIYDLFGKFISLLKGHFQNDSLWRRNLISDTNIEEILDDYINRIEQISRWSDKTKFGLKGNNRKLGMSISHYLYEFYYSEAAEQMNLELSNSDIEKAGGIAIQNDAAVGDGQGAQEKLDKVGQTRSELTEEQLLLLDEFIRTFAKSKTPEEEGSDSDKEALDHFEILRLLESIPDVDRADVLRILPDLIGKPSEETTQADMLATLQKLASISEAERQMLMTNKVLHPEAKASTEIPEAVKFALKPDAEKVFPDTGKKDENIDRMQQEIDRARAKIRKKHGPEEEGILDKIFGTSGASTIPFFNELLMFEGLLIGAGEQHPEIKGIAQEITHDISQLRILIQKEIAILVAEMGATVAFGILTSSLSGGASLIASGARYAYLADKVRRLKNLMDKVQGVYQIVTKVREVVDTVKNASEQFDRYAGQFDLMRQKWEHFQKLYDSVDAPDNIEEQLEILEAQLIEQMEGQLGDRMGEVLEEFYIPEDVSEEGLIEILFNIPRGIDAFHDLLDYYTNGLDDSNFRATLLGKAISAGALLYPVVGYLAFLTQDKLADVITEMKKSYGEKLKEWFFEGAPRLGGKRGGRKKKTSRKENKDRLSAKKRKKESEEAYKNDSGYRTAMNRQRDSGEAFMAAYLNKHGMKENASDRITFWTDRWFKIVARSGVKKLNKSKKSVKINKKPLPRFKVRKFDHESDGPDATLALNPTVEIEPGSSLWLTIDQLAIYEGESATTKGIVEQSDVDLKKKQEKELQKNFNIPSSWTIESEPTPHTTPRSLKAKRKRPNGYIYLFNGRYYWADLFNKGTKSDPIKFFWHKRSIERMQQNSKIKLLPAPIPEDQMTGDHFKEFAIKDSNTIKIPDPDSPESRSLSEKQRQLKDKEKRLTTVRQEKKSLEAEKKSGTFTTENQRIASEISAIDLEITAAKASLDQLLAAREKDPTPGKRSPTHYGKIGFARDRLTKAERTKRELTETQTRRQEVDTFNVSALEGEVAALQKEIETLKTTQEQNPKTKDEPIGVKRKYYPVKTKKLKRSPGRRDSEKDKFKKVMIAAGMEHPKNPDAAKAKYYQMEHIIDNAYDGDLSDRGADVRHNLWPITAKENPTPWQLVNAKTLTETGRKGLPNYKVGGSGGSTRFSGVWFEIANFVPDGVALSNDMVYFDEAWFKAAVSGR